MVVAERQGQGDFPLLEASLSVPKLVASFVTAISAR